MMVAEILTTERPSRGKRVRREARMVLKYTGVGLLGFATDAALLQGGLWIGLEPATARAISLIAAMQVTFLVNGCLVFRCLHRERAVRQWLRYMASNGFGNLANYFVFVAFVSSRLPVFSNHMFALAAGGTVAWALNYASTRWLVFHHGHPKLVWPWNKSRSIICED
jgi:putative flippase GtrA